MVAAIEQITVPNARFMRNAPYGRLFNWQLDWLAHFDAGLARFSILEIHRRARKTSTAVNLLIRECDKHPKCRYVYVGPTYAEVRRIIWDDPNMLKEALPDKRVLDWRLNEQHMIVKFGNGSVLQFVGGDDPDNLRGIDAEGFVFDEWSQQKEKCWTEVLQPIFRQSQERWVAFLYTPTGNNFATQMFDRAACVDEGRPLPTSGRAEKMRPNWYASRLVASESGIISDDELAAARAETPETFYAQEYECARITEEEMCLITSAMLDKLPRRVIVQPRTPRFISCDPAMGGDACVTHAFQASHVLEKMVRYTRDATQIFGELIMLGDKHHAATYVIDSIGIGQGICVPLKQAKKHVVEVCSSAESSDKGRLANYRASMWWDVMQKCRRTEIEYPADAETRRQIPYATRYKVNSSGQIQIIDKQTIKKLLGRSPDDAESWGMGVAHIHLAKTPDEVETIAITDAMRATDYDDEADYDRLSLEGLGIRV